MLKDVKVKLNETIYTWKYDEDESQASECWHWVRSDDGIDPPEVVVHELNRAFISRRAAQLCRGLSARDQARFRSILRSMNAPQSIIDRYTSDNEAAIGRTPFDDTTLRDFVFQNVQLPPNLPRRPSLFGSGPFTQPDLTAFLRRHQLQPRRISDAPNAIVLGRSGWTPEDLDVIANMSRDTDIRIFSQEMLLSFWLSGRNPFAAGLRTLTAFKDGHRGLERLCEGWEGWVQTDATMMSSEGSQDNQGRRDESPLARLGYAVGHYGQSMHVRQRILSQAFREPLPHGFDYLYLQSWGQPQSPTRLHKIAAHIARLCRDAKRRRNQDMSNAVSDWEADLAWLKRTYYHGHMTFSWPST